ncbi:MAG: hypothetical protein HGB12_02505 [Bacteroidetes bacterium]|nr:hypothetical protein [Bacteroidota bacterium]
MKKHKVTQPINVKTFTTIVCTLVLIVSYSRTSQAQLSKNIDSTELRFSYNSKTTVLDSGKRQTEFHGKWINYMDENGTWKEINPVFVKTVRGFEMDKAPFEVLAPFFANEPAIFNNNNRYDVFANEIISDKPLEQTIQAIGTAHVAGITETGDLGWGKAQYVVYPNAYPEIQADLIYWVHQGVAPRLRKFIRFNQQLAENTDFQFRVIYSDEVETVNNDKNVTVKLKGVNSKRGNGWDDFYIWDSKDGWTGRKPIRFDFEKQILASVNGITTDPNEYILTKHIEADYFKTATLPVFTDATSTFYPDAHTESASTDACVGRFSVNETWATIRDGNGTTADVDLANSEIINVADATGTNWKHMRRAIYLFDTSTLPDDCSISNSTFSLFGSSKYDYYTESASLVSSNPSTNTAIIASDYGTFGTTKFANDIAISAFSTSGYNDWSMNSSGLSSISKTGVTKLGVRTANEINTDTHPSSGTNGQGSRIEGYYSEQTGTDYDPKLVVNYTTSTPASVDWNNSNVQEITLSADRSFIFTNGKSGGVYTLIIKQDATGGRIVTWSSNVKWAGAGTAPTLTTTAGAAAQIRFVCDGTNYLEGGIYQYIAP